MTSEDWIVEISKEDVGNVLQAVAMGKSEPLSIPSRHLELRYEKIPIARVAWEEEHQDHRIVALACHSGFHGVTNPKWVDLGEVLDRLEHLKEKKKNRVCIVCGGTNWLPATGEKAKTAAILAGQLRMYRGVEFTPSEEFSGFIEKAVPFILASLLP